MQDFLNWGKATAGWDIPEQGGPNFVPGVKAGELCPGHTDTVAVLGIGTISPCRTDHTSLGGKISSGLQTGSPRSLMGQADARGSGAWGGPGERAGEGIKALK